MSLHHEAAQRWGRRCPCCERVMTPSRPIEPGLRMPDNMATKGHDVAVGNGGHYKEWLYQCWRCNNLMANQSYEQWAKRLRWKDDPIAANVETVAVFVRQWRQRKRWLDDHRRQEMAE